MKLFWWKRRKSLKEILETARKSRSDYLNEDDLQNILFLDFDGVVNISLNPRSPLCFDERCMNNVNKLCHRFNLKIVVISSWKRQYKYKEILYNQGLDKDIEVIGKTDDLNGPREDEVKKYLEDNIYIDKFIILDDAFFNELTPYQIKPTFAVGFDQKKYQEAVKLLENQKGNR